LTKAGEVALFAFHNEGFVETRFLPAARGFGRLRES
jgi:hypothetical protein